MIRALNPAARLVPVSETANGRLVRRAIEYGFQAVVAKPVPPRALDDLLDSGTAS